MGWSSALSVLQVHTLIVGQTGSAVSLVPLGNKAIRLIVFAEVVVPSSGFQCESWGAGCFTLERAMKESTATAVNMMVGISMTTAEPTLVLKKVMVASQPLKVRRQHSWH